MRWDNRMEDELTPRHKHVLKSAEFMLQPDRPDTFDLDAVSALSGVPRQELVDSFPFPELLTVGALAAGRLEFQDALAARPCKHQSWWAQVLEICRFFGHSCLQRPHSAKLETQGWEPDPALMMAFADHAVVRAYGQSGQALVPALERAWPRTGAPCSPGFVAAIWNGHLQQVLGSRRTGAKHESEPSWQAWAQDLLIDFLLGLRELLVSPNFNHGLAVPTTAGEQSS